MSKRNLYLKTIQTIRRERGEYCECCGMPATHGHHVIPVSETSICSALVFEPANILILCDDCHALMHAHAGISQKLNEAINGNGEDEQPAQVERAQPIGQFVDIFNDT